MFTPKITKCTARQILDSRGKATIEVEVSAGEIDPVMATASMPATENVDAQAFTSFGTDGGIGNALENIEKMIAPKILGMDASADEIDRVMLRMDMTRHKTILGTSAMIGISMAATRLEAKVKNIPLWKLISEKTDTPPAKPFLYVSMLSGGVHTDFFLPFREYMAVIGENTLAASYEKSKAVFRRVREKLDAEGAEYYTSDEGGFAVRFDTLEKPFEVLAEACAGESNMFLALDAAASEFYKNGKYEVLGKSLGRGELLLSYQPLVEKFLLKSIEDPFDKNDIEGFQEAMQWYKDSALIVGNDFTMTNPALIQEYGEKGLANAVVIKPNQIGTLTEVYDAIGTARRHGWKIIVSHGVGETPDSFISDLAVGVGAFGIKAGVYTQAERAAKYERLVEIEKEMETEGNNT